MTRARDVATQGGLVLISSTTVGSAVSSVTVNNAFSSSYDNYSVIYTGGIGNNNYISCRIGGVSTGSYYFSRVTAAFSTAGVSNGGGNGVTSFQNLTYMTATGGTLKMDIFSPFLADETHIISTGIEATANSTGSSYQESGFLNTTASYTTFEFSTAGTITGGTIQVYGYKK